MKVILVLKSAKFFYQLIRNERNVPKALGRTLGNPRQEEEVSVPTAAADNYPGGAEFIHFQFSPSICRHQSAFQPRGRFLEGPSVKSPEIPEALQGTMHLMD